MSMADSSIAPRTGAAGAKERAAVSICCPAFNAAAVLTAAMASWRAQTVAVVEIIVVDDGSVDATAGVAEACGARVIRFEQNCGRGAARAAAVHAARGEFIVFADAHNVLAPDFVEEALLRLAVDPKLVGVVGQWHEPAPRGVRSRWRARHLYRCGRDDESGPKTLSTHACVLRREAVLAAGNFDARLRADEDSELGERLARRGGRFAWVRACRVSPQVQNTWSELVERHTRWYVRADERVSLRWYGRWLAYAIKVMVPADLRAHDPVAAGLSLWLPQAMARRLWRRRFS